MSEDTKKADKRKRTTARGKFTRIFNALCEHIDDEDASVETLNSIFSNLDASAYTELEVTTETYLTYFDSDDEECELSNNHLEESYRIRCRMHIKLSKKYTPANLAFPLTTGTDAMETNTNRFMLPLQSSASPTAMNVKKLDALKFSGELREFPTFVKDYTKYMEPTYGEDSYALRSCLAGKALDVVIGVDDDYGEMWRRLNTVFCDSGKIVDSILSEIKQLTPLKENDSAWLINLVNTVERCWLDLKKINLEREMNTSTMTSYVERLLPSIQKRE